MKSVLLRFLFLFFSCLSGILNACDAVLPGCDTLFSSDGKQYMIRLLETKTDGIIFATCNEPDGERYSLPNEKIIRIGKSKDGDQSNKSASKDPLSRQAKSAMILSIIGVSMLVITWLLPISSAVMSLRLILFPLTREFNVISFCFIQYNF